MTRIFFFIRQCKVGDSHIPNSVTDIYSKSVTKHILSRWQNIYLVGDKTYTYLVTKKNTKSVTTIYQAKHTITLRQPYTKSVTNTYKLGDKQTKSVTNTCIYKLDDKHILTRWQPHTNLVTNMYQVGDKQFNQKTAVARIVTVCHRVSTCLSPSLCHWVFIDVTEFLSMSPSWFVADLCGNH